jgi:hypothetical protein
VTAPGARYDRYDRYFYAMAAAMAAIAVVSAVGAAVVFGTPWYLAAVAFAAVAFAAYIALYPWLRARWYEAGYLAATPTLPVYRAGENGGYAVFASEAIDGDPGHQAVMVAVRGVACRPLLDVDSRPTAEWIVTIPQPPGARIDRTHVAELPGTGPRPPG